MKTIKIIFGWALIAAFPLSSVAANTSVAKESSSKDAFISFVLDKAKTYTDKAEIAVSKAVDVVSSEAPLLVSEFLRWRVWMHGMSFFIPFVLMCCGFFMFFNFFDRWKMQPYGDALKEGEVSDVVATVVFGALFLINVIISIVSIGHLMSFVQVLVAPRVYLVEEVIKVLK